MTARCPAGPGGALETGDLRHIFPAGRLTTAQRYERSMTMNLTRYNFGLPSLRDEFKQAFEMLNRMARLDEGDQSNIVTSEWMPRVDIKEEDDRFVILADIPGVDPKDIEVSMDKGVLSIRGERRTESREETERYTRLERSRGVFYRRFALP